uniref:zinc finger BED domain-containing protein 4-like isoform X1 n=1 Tax=Myxine glutinosa TaxID=7769 RepID=UPI00358DEA90
MASKLKITVFDYFDVVSENGDGKIASQCRTCGAIIHGNRNVTSNFITHIKRMHSLKYDEFTKKRIEANELPRSSEVRFPSQQQTSSSPMSKFSQSDPRQKIISEAIAKMIIKDLQSAKIVEKEGFCDLLALLEPHYIMASSKYIQQHLLIQYVSRVQNATRRALRAVESYCITLDILGSQMNGYLGLTCYFITHDWAIKSVLLACSHLTGNHTIEKFLAQYAEGGAHNVSSKIFRLVIGGVAHVSKGLVLPGFCFQSDEDDSQEDTNTNNSVDEKEDPIYLCFGPPQIECFAHSLELCVKDGLNALPKLFLSLGKAARIINHVRVTLTPEVFEEVFGPMLFSRNETCWNSQLKVVRKFLEASDFLEEIIDKFNLKLSESDKGVLKELIELLEPFEEAIDMMHGDTFVSISLALPCILGLKKHLSKATSNQYCSTIVDSLTQSLDKRLGSLIQDPLYITASILDPRFKLLWSNNTDGHIQTLLQELSKYSTSEPTPADDKLLEEEVVPAKKSKLFSFLKEKPIVQYKGIEEELDAYLREEPLEEGALHYWKRKAAEFPQLSQAAKRILAVPATSAPVEKILCTVGKTFDVKSQLLPNNLQTLIFLKANYDFLFS